MSEIQQRLKALQRKVRRQEKNCSLARLALRTHRVEPLQVALEQRVTLRRSLQLLRPEATSARRCFEAQTGGAVRIALGVASAAAAGARLELQPGGVLEVAAAAGGRAGGGGGRRAEVASRGEGLRANGHVCVSGARCRRRRGVRRGGPPSAAGRPRRGWQRTPRAELRNGERSSRVVPRFRPPARTAWPRRSGAGAAARGTSSRFGRANARRPTPAQRRALPPKTAFRAAWREQLRPRSCSARRRRVAAPRAPAARRSRGVRRPPPAPAPRGRAAAPGGERLRAAWCGCAGRPAAQAKSATRGAARSCGATRRPERRRKRATPVHFSGGAHLKRGRASLAHQRSGHGRQRRSGAVGRW